MGYENLPQVIKDSCGFCCWKREMVSGRMTKVPYNPLSGKKVGANRPQDFVDYVTADKYKEGYEGLGIRVSGRIFAFDLDHCIEEGPDDAVGEGHHLHTLRTPISRRGPRRYRTYGYSASRRTVSNMTRIPTTLKKEMSKPTPRR